MREAHQFGTRPALSLPPVDRPFTDFHNQQGEVCRHTARFLVAQLPKKIHSQKSDWVEGGVTPQRPSQSAPALLEARGYGEW